MTARDHFGSLALVSFRVHSIGDWEGTMSHEAILDGSLYVRHDLAGIRERNRAFTLRNASRAHFASQILFYDRVIVPTKDFGILASIKSWGDANLLSEMLETSAISFVRPGSLIGFVGNGAGLNTFKIEYDRHASVAWEADTMWADLATSCEAQIRHGCAITDPELANAHRAASP